MNHCLLPSLALIIAGSICSCTSNPSRENLYGSRGVDRDSLNSAHLNQMEFRRFDKDRDTLISREEFNNLTRAMNQVHSDDPTKVPVDRFASYDQDADNHLSIHEFEFSYVRDTLSWPGPFHSNVVYKKAGSELLFMDILMPTNPRFENAPVFYFIHGGGFRSGAKEYLRLNDLRAETAFQFAEKGFCCVSVQYRLVNHDPGKSPVLIGDCVTDAWDGLRFLQKHADNYHIDPAKIIVWGESAGGHIAQMLTFTDPEEFPGDPDLADVHIRPAGGISWYGPSDFTGSLIEEAGNSLQNRHLRNITGKNSYSDEDLYLVREMSPIFQLDSQDPPLLLMQGDSDHAVHLSHATKLDERAKELGADVELLVVTNAGHNWRQVGNPIEPSKTEIKDMMLEFAQRILKE